MVNNVKKTIKESFAGIFISLCLSFMLIFYEPLNIFANNLEDFWFDIYTFFPITLGLFVFSFLVLSIFFIVIKKINKKVYMFFIVSFLIGTICTYVQGNFLVGSLPPIDGTWIDWDVYKTEKMISLILWIVVTAIVLFSLYKFKFEKIECASKYVSIVIIIMLASSLISVVSIDGFFDKKKTIVATFDNYDNMSSNKNFIIFMVDAVDSVAFDKELKKLNKTDEIFEDFTYYPDTLAAYPFTRNSIPLILGGKWYENERDFKEYFTETFDESKFFKKLEEEDYVLNLYEDDLNNYNGNKYSRFSNVIKFSELNLIGLIKQEAKIILFKYLPYQLKWRSRIDSFDMGQSKIDKKNNLYERFNIPNYEKISNDDINIIEDNNFQFIHLEGGHVPKRYDINLNIVENGTYEGNLDACVTIIETYLNKLRSNGVYDNSVIVVMSDHGYGSTNYVRQNPILYIKGINEKHDYQVSDKKISYIDLIPAFNQLINGDSSDKLFENLDNTERRFLFYEYSNPDIIIEQTLKGKASDASSLKDTGKKFIRR